MDVQKMNKHLLSLTQFSQNRSFQTSLKRKYELKYPSKNLSFYWNIQI